VWDVRNTAESIRVLSGHIPPQQAHRLKQISRPRWLPSSAATSSDSEVKERKPWDVIAVQGEHSTKLTLFDASTGNVLSRGELQSAATTIANVGYEEEALVAVAMLDGTISFLVPG
jgi:hypothetical protein